MSLPTGILTYSGGGVVGPIANFERNEPFSVELWFYQTAAKTVALASHMLDAPTRRGWLVNVWNFRNVGMLLCHDEASGNFLHCRTGSSQYSINAWNHIVFTYSGGNTPGSFKCYINNSQKTLSQIGTYNITDTMKSDLAKFWVGHSYVYQYFPGRIDEFVLYDRVLSASEISQRYNSGVGRENLIGLAYLQWHLNEASGSAVADSSGNGRGGLTIASPSFIAGKLNNCLQLNGSSQHVEA